jgi:hypothetical protein
MPGEVGGVGAEGGLGVEGEGLAVEVGEFEAGAAGEDGFGDVRFGDADSEVWDVFIHTLDHGASLAVFGPASKSSYAR